jgi:hypothetical protein
MERIAETRRHSMIATLNFATLAAATIFAAAAALAVDWLLLKVAFVLMRPATAQQTQLGTCPRNSKPD